MSTRQTAQREWQLLSWWLVQNHPDAQIWMNLRIGPTLPISGKYPLTVAEQNYSRVRNRWTDAIFVENGTANIVEAKMQPDPGIFSQLIHYARKLRLDPNWTQFAAYPLNLIALVARDDPSVSLEAPAYGVTWVVYQPSFLAAQQIEPVDGGNTVSNVPLPQDFPARLNLLNLAGVAPTQ